MTFAFGTADMVLLPIDEDYEEISASECDEAAAKAVLETSKLRTAKLTEAASKDITELASLLDKLKTNTATRDEKERVHSLHARLDGMKREIEVTKDRESTAEMEFLHTKTKVKTKALKTAVKEKEIRSVIRSVCAGESVDLAFIMDCTSSMSSYIAAVKNSINDIVGRIGKTNGNLKLRLAMVAYRDLCDGPKRFEVLDFVSSVDEFQNFVGRLSATGGGDAAEDIAGAVQEATGLKWANATRVAFLIADCPCHGNEFHSLGSDDYVGGTPGIDIIAELKTLQAMKGNGTMTLNFGRITNHTDKMVNRFHDLGIAMDVVSIHDTAKVTACVTKSVRKSIFKTMTFASGGTKSVAFGPLSKDPSEKKEGLSSVVSLKAYTITPDDPSADEWMCHVK